MTIGEKLREARKTHGLSQLQCVRSSLNSS